VGRPVARRLLERSSVDVERDIARGDVERPAQQRFDERSFFQRTA
jgi:hypothetical protein